MAYTIECSLEDSWPWVPTSSGYLYNIAPTTKAQGTPKKREQEETEDQGYPLYMSGRLCPWELRNIAA